jgi:cytochrome-b5 reductase
LNEQRDAALIQDSFEVPVPMDRVTRIKTTTPSPYPLTAIRIDTHDTKTFRFGLSSDATLDMLPDDYLYVHATINGKP